VGVRRNHERLLVVDDDPTFRDVLGMRLEGWGYQVRLASSVAEARGIMESWTPQLIVSDVVMPEVSGLRFVTQLRSERVTCPVVLLSAHATAEMTRHAQHVEGVVFLAKPVDYADFRGAVDGLLRAVGTGRGGSDEHHG
jgi:DNA-binding NtrC family response regulator